MPIKETASDALWMGVLVAKKIIEDHSTSIVISFPVIFLAAFGFSLPFALEGQFWRGK